MQFTRPVSGGQCSKRLLCFLLQLTFSSFNLEPHSQCGWDSVTIFNGGSPGSPIIGQYCGTTSPGTLQSGSNKMAIVFLADHSVAKGGFLATWSSDSSGSFTSVLMDVLFAVHSFIHFLFQLVPERCLLLCGPAMSW